MATSTFDSVPLPASNPIGIKSHGAGVPPHRDEQQLPHQQQQSLGLKAIYTACCELYPDQPTPLQVTAVRKYWMGGPDPLDFINIYSNPGSMELNSPPHWHYVTNGLSDLYGDARLHGSSTSVNDPSGFGFEFTLRICRRPTENNPPTWPAHLLQSLARYVFHSQAQIMLGDHIPWPTPLDEQPYTPPTNPTEQQQDNSSNIQSPMNPQSIAIAAATAATSILAANNPGGANASVLHNPSTYASIVAAALAAVKSASDASSANKEQTDPTMKSSSDCLIHHMLVVEDAQLRRITTPYGYVQFLQLVGLCEQELRLVQRWTGNLVADLMRCRFETGGRLLVTDMNRRLTVFELEPNLHQYVNDQLKREGSNLTGVTTQYFAWGAISLTTLKEPIPGERSSRYNQFRSQSRNNVSSTEAHLPTDLSTRAACDEDDAASDVAMETDDTVVSACIKKETEDEKFIDVVGDEPCSGPYENDAKLVLPSYPSSESLIHLHSQRSAEIGSPYQPTSAPGKFSAWCNRLSSQYEKQSEHELDGTAVPTNSRSMLNKMDENALKVASRNSIQSDKKANGTHNHPTQISQTTGAFGFKAFTATESFCPPPPQVGSRTPGSAGGEGSAPCTPLAHLSLSPASLDLMPNRVIDCLDVYFCAEAGEMLPLAVTHRLRHGRHFTFLNAHYPDHAITLVPSGMSGAFVTDANPYVARGPWLQILLPNDLLDRLESEFSVLKSSREFALPLAFRWPDRRLRICLVDSPPNPTAAHGAIMGPSNPNALLPKALSLSQGPLSDWPPSHPSPSASSNKSESSHHFFGSRVNRPTTESNFPHFPPGFVPPPEMLATLFHASNYGQTRQSPMSSGHPNGAMKLPTVGSSNWMCQSDLAPNVSSGSRSDPYFSAAISEGMRAAMAAMQQYLGGTSRTPPLSGTVYPLAPSQNLSKM